jgi:hypothetical protein
LWYWSSSSVVGNTTHAWAVNFQIGSVDHDWKPTPYRFYVRAVRG